MLIGLTGLAGWWVYGRAPYLMRYYWMYVDHKRSMEKVEGHPICRSEIDFAVIKVDNLN